MITLYSTVQITCTAQYISLKANNLYLHTTYKLRAVTERAIETIHKETTNEWPV